RRPHSSPARDMALVRSVLGPTDSRHPALSGSCGLDSRLQPQRRRDEIRPGLPGARLRALMQLSQGILLDIEGTTTPISFVYELLFPSARSHVREHLGPEEVRALRAEYESEIRNGQVPPPWSETPVEYVHWLMDQDRKSTALKNLQGKIWLDGYRRGELHGDVFDDVPPALKRWMDRDVDVRIYSSGS